MRARALCALAALIVASATGLALAQGTYPGAPPPPQPGYAAPQPAGSTFNAQEIIDAGHTFFGGASTELASVVEYTFASRGEPTGYIVGQEASGAFFGGLRYGEGQLRMKTGQVVPVFWQGPSLGLDFGADGSRIMILVYDLAHAQQVFDVFAGPSGLAYVAGGLGVSFHTSGQNIALGVIRTGVGLRLGFNVGYLRVTPQPTWNPF